MTPLPEETPEAAEALATALSGCISNVSDLPEWMRAPALGRDTRPILLLVARAVLASDWLATLLADARREGGDERAEKMKPASTATPAVDRSLSSSCEVMLQASGLPSDTDDIDLIEETALGRVARAESAEAAHEALRAGVEALAGRLAATYEHHRINSTALGMGPLVSALGDAAHDLRALAGGTQ